MSNFTVEGGIHAGRDNIINVGDRQSYKRLDQCTPDELRQEDQHIYLVSRQYRNGLVRKSKLWLVLLLIGIAGVGAVAFFVHEIFVSYVGGAKPNLQVLFRFAVDSARPDPDFFLFKIAGFIIFTLLTVILPAAAVAKLWFADDEFLREQKSTRDWIKKRLIKMGQ